MATWATFQAWLASRKGQRAEAKRTIKLAKEVAEWNKAVETGKISRKGHRNDATR